jgi:uncharacterized protein
MKKILIAFVLELLCASSFAQTPSDASIDELLMLSKVNQIADAVMVPMEQMMRQNIAAFQQGKQVTSQERQSIENFIPKAMQIARDELAFNNLRNLYIEIYKATFTQEEVDGLIIFYKTPAGLALVNKMPAIAQKTMTLIQAKIQPMNVRMQAAMKQAMDEAKQIK